MSSNKEKKSSVELRGHTQLLTLLTYCPIVGVNPHCEALELLPMEAGLTPVCLLFSV